MNESLKRYYLKQMGIEVWELKGKKNALHPPSALSGTFPHKGGRDSARRLSDEQNSSWETLKKQAESCQACSLAKTRTQVVFGVGNPKADWMIIGEAPGFYEDQQGEPFVGMAGQLLNAMLASVGKKREDVYIANVLKCRTPDNRDPLPEEVAECSPFLKQQIQAVSPKVILVLGQHAARFLLNTEESMGKLRGHCYHWGEEKIPVWVSYQPFLLIQNDAQLAWY